MEDYNVNNTEANTEDTAVEVIEPVTMEEVDVKKQKKRDALMFGGGILSGILAAVIYCRKVRPALKRVKEAKKAAKAAKEAAAREDAKNPIEGNFEETEG